MHSIPKTMGAMSPANGSLSSSLPVSDIRERALPSYHATRDVVAALTSEASNPKAPDYPQVPWILANRCFGMPFFKEGECFSFVSRKA